MRNAITVLASTALAATVIVTVVSTPADAQSRRPAPQPPVAADGGHPASGYYRRAPQVRGFVQRRGGYSYSWSDVANTYGLSRSIYGGVNAYRDPFADRQTRNGPFDHGFFFDSGIAPRGGDSPYRN
jgi:hypothetical protein